MAALILAGDSLSEKKFRSWTPEEMTNIVRSGLGCDRSVRDVCREHGMSENRLRPVAEPATGVWRGGPALSERETS